MPFSTSSSPSNRTSSETKPKWSCGGGSDRHHVATDSPESRVSTTGSNSFISNFAERRRNDIGHA